MILQIDHILIVVPDLDAARRGFRSAGCPILWDGVWNDSGASVSLFGVSVGPVNLEILSAQALSLFGRPAGAFGVASVAFDPDDTERTVAGLREAGFAVPDGRPWQAGETFVSSLPDASLPSGGVNTPLPDTLPGLPAFLSEYLPPHRHRGRAMPDSPIRFVELSVGRPEPERDVERFERALGVHARREGDGFLLPLADTPLRLLAGEGCDVVLRAAGGRAPVESLVEAVPGLRWALTP